MRVETSSPSVNEDAKGVKQRRRRRLPNPGYQSAVAECEYSWLETCSRHACALAPYSRRMSPRDVLILGAGFSKAVHDSMPVLSTLKDRVLEETGLVNDPRVPSRAFGQSYTFEDWLSTLSEEQPYLSEAENRSNAALFAQLRDAIAVVLSRDEAEAAASGVPRWLDSLVRLLHHHEATVITLNYDRLIEVALRRANLKDLRADNGRMIDDRSAVRDVPPTRLHQSTYLDLGGWTHSATMRLLKLHGSLDWWMSPRDATGATLVREELRFDQFGMPIPPSPADRTRTLTGREVFLVPPILTKVAYFTNVVTRELWKNAHQALSGADLVTIVGYSLPPGDSMMSGLLVSTLQRENLAVTVVNPDAAEVAKRACRLGIGPVAEFSGEACVADYVASYLDRADSEFRASFLKPSLLNHDPLPLIVSTGSGDHTNLLYRVVKIEPVASDEIVLRTVKRGNVMQNAASNESFGDPRELPTARNLADSLEGVSRVVVDLDGTPDGLCRPVRAVPGHSVTGVTPIAALLIVVPDPAPSRLA